MSRVWMKKVNLLVREMFSSLSDGLMCNNNETTGRVFVNVVVVGWWYSSAEEICVCVIENMMRNGLVVVGVWLKWNRSHLLA